MEQSKMKVAYVITERGDKTYWTRIGVAFTNKDGSLNVKLDAIPVGGTLQIRDWEPREDAREDADGAPDGNAASSAPRRTNMRPQAAL